MTLVNFETSQTLKHYPVHTLIKDFTSYYGCDCWIFIRRLTVKEFYQQLGISLLYCTIIVLTDLLFVVLNKCQPDDEKLRDHQTYD